MEKSEAYEILFRLKKERNLDVDNLIERLSLSETVPKTVVKFIENNSTITLSDFIKIISRTKQFYSNIVFNYEDNVDTYVKAFLSLLTHIEITLEKNPHLKDELLELFDIDRIMKIVSDKMKFGNNDNEVIELAHELKLIYLSCGEREE